jgi:hypothetical protein
VALKFTNEHAGALAVVAFIVAIVALVGVALGQVAF